MRTTSTTALDAHAGVLPMHIAINKICLRAALRFATLPHSHPLYPYIRRAAKTCTKKFPSPLHHTMDAFNVDPVTTETILPV